MHQVMTDFLVQQARTEFPIRKEKLQMRQEIGILANLPKQCRPVLEKQLVTLISDLIDIDSGIDTSDSNDHKKKSVLNSTPFQMH